MRILNRYVLREFLIPFSYCLLGLISVYLIFESFDVISALFEKRPPLSMILAYFGGKVALYLEWILPAAFLLATLYTMWQFCRYSELTAMRANGIGFLVIVRPILAVACLGALLCFLTNEYYTPAAAEYIKKIQVSKFSPVPPDVRKAIPHINHAENRSWMINEVDLNDPSVLKGVKVSVSRPDTTKNYDIATHRAEYLDGVWWFYAPTWQFFDEFNAPIDPPSPDFEKATLRPMFFLTETPNDILLQNRTIEFYNIQDLRHYLRQNPYLQKDDKVHREYEIYRRIASPLSSIVIALFAIPAGVATGRQSVFKGIIAAIALFLGFYLLTSMGMVLAKREMLSPAFAAFLPGLTFLTLGAILFYRQR